ncbi:hypothetical protein VNO77_16622 [Canavalia gladiata]|uniref:Uncharacterized protein n=1 Tax=Canavalia gladiata TaxID=3824 RepID=A0AAN9LHQ8_CANGL
MSEFRFRHRLDVAENDDVIILRMKSDLDRFSPGADSFLLRPRERCPWNPTDKLKDQPSTEFEQKSIDGDETSKVNNNLLVVNCKLGVKTRIRIVQRMIYVMQCNARTLGKGNAELGFVNPTILHFNAM